MKKIEIEDRRTSSLPEEEEPAVKFRISPIVAPRDPKDNLIQPPGETPMDDTSKVAMGSPRFKQSEKVVAILTADNDVVPWYKQKFVGPRCTCMDKKEKEKKNTVEIAYCPICFHTGVEMGYGYDKRVKLLDVYVEWGGIDPPFPSGRLEAHLDFEYHPTPGDFFELGKTLADVGFNANAGVSERHDNEGQPCLWRVDDVSVTRDEVGFPLFWAVACRNVEPYEPVFGWFEENAGNE